MAGRYPSLPGMKRAGAREARPIFTEENEANETASRGNEQIRRSSSSSD
jgi:hypothetical protein